MIPLFTLTLACLLSAAVTPASGFLLESTRPIPHVVSIEREPKDPLDNNLNILAAPRQTDEPASTLWRIGTDAVDSTPALTDRDKKDRLYRRRGVLVGGVILFGVDQELLNGLQKIRDESFTTLLDNAEPLGDHYAVLIPAAYYIHSKLLGGGENSFRTARDSTHAALIAAVGTHVLKIVVGRERPRRENGPYQFHPFGADDRSFPSGHTTSAFAMATAVAMNSEHPLVPYVAYTTATLVGLQRIHVDAHWPSDVFFGAAIGHGVANWVVKRNADKKKDILSRLILFPNSADGTLNLAYVFDP